MGSRDDIAADTQQETSKTVAAATPARPTAQPTLADRVLASSDRRMRPWPDAAASRAQPINVPGTPAANARRGRWREIVRG